MESKERVQNENSSAPPKRDSSQILGDCFERYGALVARMPWVFIAGSVIWTIVMAALAATQLDTESRAEKQWVADGSPGLDHNDYVQAHWPSSGRFNQWIATCDGGCNLLSSSALQQLSRVHESVLAVTVSGDGYTDKKASYAGMWSFEGDPNGTTKAKCLERGPGQCMLTNVLEIWGYSAPRVGALTDAAALGDVAQWEAGGEPPRVATVAGGLQRSAAGEPTSAAALWGSYTIASDDYTDPKTMRVEDFVAIDWEGRALDALGVTAGADTGALRFKAIFARSFGDEFGSAIRGDISKIGIAYMIIIVYLFCVLGRRDTVHCMIGLSGAAIISVGMAIATSFGVAAICGIPNNNLVQNLYFLLLGLGVDDTFVLTSEYQRAASDPATRHAGSSHHVALAARNGAVSILVTSLTDALAFLIGSATVLPALRWFCQYAGIGVFFCFVFQLTFYLPCVAIDARRAAAGKVDCCCCCAAGGEEHDITKPRGWLCCNCGACLMPGGVPVLAQLLERCCNVMLSRAGMGAVFVTFVALLCAGISGCTQMYKDFRLEWFIPDGSYVNEFTELNKQYFDVGTPASVYVKDIDYYARQGELAGLHTFLTTSAYVDQTMSIDDWMHEFTTSSAATTYSDAASWYVALSAWTQGAAGARHAAALKWHDASDPGRGLLSSRMRFMVAKDKTTTGDDRYNAMVALRDGVGAALPGGAAFPFARDFIFWEEMGVIDREFARNVGICGGVILLVIAAMIPSPRVAPLVVLSIMLAIVDTIGFLYYWGVTINGVSTIFILITIGLAVDYSAHIGHMFKVSGGTAPERAHAAVVRIGPCVLNAVASTFLAVVVIGFSDTFIFRTMFKCLCACTLLGGAHGLVLLPVLLAAAGGDAARPAAAKDAAAAAAQPMQPVPAPEQQPTRTGVPAAD